MNRHKFKTDTLTHSTTIWRHICPTHTDATSSVYSSLRNSYEFFTSISVSSKYGIPRCSTWKTKSTLNSIPGWSRRKEKARTRTPFYMHSEYNLNLHLWVVNNPIYLHSIRAERKRRWTKKKKKKKKLNEIKTGSLKYGHVIIVPNFLCTYKKWRREAAKKNHTPDAHMLVDRVRCVYVHHTNAYTYMIKLHFFFLILLLVLVHRRCVVCRSRPKSSSSSHFFV